MRYLLTIAAGMVLIGWAGGCTGSGRVLSELPDPVFATAPRESPPVQVVPEFRPPPPTAPVRADASWMPPGGISPRWACIVIHHSGSEIGGARAFDDFHRNVRKWDELGYHFVIGNGSDTGDGQIEVGSRWTKQKHGAHCKTPDNYYNDHGVGICLVGDFDRRGPTSAQMASLARLIGFLTRECGIPESRILTHGGVTHRTDCPGAHFSLAELRARLDSGVAAVSHIP